MNIAVLILAALMPMVIHELGHFVTAYILTGEKIVFRFETAKLWIIPIPRWTWDFPAKVKDVRQKRLIAQAGFLFEIAAIAFMPWTYADVTVSHFALYPWYAGERNDFQWLF